MIEQRGRRTSEERWAEALTWYFHLRHAKERDLGDAIGRRWERWYSDIENRRVFDNVSRLHAERDLYRTPSRPTEAELTEDKYDLSVPIAEWRARSTLRKSKRNHITSRRWIWSLSAGLGVAAIAALFFLWPLYPAFRGEPKGAVIYQTGLGSLKEVHLPDGSAIILGGETKVSVAFSALHRSVNLVEGQVWFKVAHDRHWPFVVAAGDGTITAVGTAFLVTRQSDRVVVTVTEGTVEVSALQTLRHARISERQGSSTLSPTLVRLGRDEELAFSDDGTLSRIEPTDAHAATSWTHGRLTFDDQPLRYVIETIDRYSSRHIVVSNSAGALRFSGIVLNDQVDDWLKSLTAIFPVIVDESGPDVRIQMRTPPSIPVRGRNPP